MNKVYSNKRAFLEMRNARLVYSDEKFQFFFKSHFPWTGSAKNPFSTEAAIRCLTKTYSNAPDTLKQA